MGTVQRTVRTEPTAGISRSRMAANSSWGHPGPARLAMAATRPSLRNPDFFLVMHGSTVPDRPRAVRWFVPLQRTEPFSALRGHPRVHRLQAGSAADRGDNRLGSVAP